MVRLPIPIPEAKKIPEAKAAVDKDGGKLENLPAWQESKVRNKQEEIKEAQKERINVHVATIMDLFHLKIQNWTKHSRSTKVASCCVVMQCRTVQAVFRY